MSPERFDALVIGGGPAGLMAAEVLAAGGAKVLIADAKPSFARKLLMAGKSGLNLTYDCDLPELLGAYGEASKYLKPMLQEFDARDVRRWAEGLGQEVFTGSTGRVFPRAMKASPLLRTWFARLNGAGAEARTRWHWQNWEGDSHLFETPDGPKTVTASATIFALGGASWSRLGSDGAWADAFQKQGVVLTPFQPTNGAVLLNWSAHMEPHLGSPVKGVALRCGGLVSRGEFTLSKSGLEGGGIYEVFTAIRAGKPAYLDLFPDLGVDEIAARLARVSGRQSRSNRLRKALRLGGVRLALLNEFARPLPADAELPARLKSLSVPISGLAPMDQAISTAGGVSFSALDENLMLADLPGTYVVGEMLDWEAPTGGYLLTACLATGRWAGQAALRQLGL